MDDDPDFDFIVGLAAQPAALPGDALAPAPGAALDAQGEEALALVIADPESDDLQELVELAVAPPPPPPTETAIRAAEPGIA